MAPWQRVCVVLILFAGAFVAIPAALIGMTMWVEGHGWPRGYVMGGLSILYGLSIVIYAVLGWEKSLRLWPFESLLRSRRWVIVFGLVIVALGCATIGLVYLSAVPNRAVGQDDQAIQPRDRAA